VGERESSFGHVSGESRSVLPEPVDVVAEFERGAQLQAQILHHHLTLQQQEGVSVDLLGDTETHGADSRIIITLIMPRCEHKGLLEA